MIDQKNSELVQAGVDGALNDDDRRRLDALLAASPEARDLHEDLTRLTAFIDRAPELPVPDSLHDAIIRSVELPAPAPWRRWFRFSELPGALRYGLAGAAAMLLTVAVYQGGERIDPERGYDDLVGTITGGKNDREIDEVAFGGADARGEARLLTRADGYALAVDLDLAAPTDLAITLPGEIFRFNALAQGADTLSSVSWSGNRLSATATGKQRFVVLLGTARGPAEAAGEITLSLSRNGTVLHAGALDPSSTED